MNSLINTAAAPASTHPKEKEKKSVSVFSIFCVRILVFDFPFWILDFQFDSSFFFTVVY